MNNKERVTQIVGTGNVSYESIALDEYSSDMSFVNVIKPLGLLKPKNAVEIQQIVKWASDTHTPTVPVRSNQVYPITIYGGARL